MRRWALGLAVLFVGCQGGGDPPDLCANVNCGDGLSCDPASGECVNDITPDLCDGVSCSGGISCNPESGVCDVVDNPDVVCNGDGDDILEEADGEFLADNIDVTIAGTLQPINADLVNDLGLDVQCGGVADGPDAVFQIDIGELSDLRVETLVQPGGEDDDTVLYLVQGSCNVFSASADEVVCADRLNVQSSPEAAAFSFRELAPGTYFLFVDSKLGSPLASTQIVVSRTRVLSQGDQCSVGLATQRCGLGTACRFVDAKSSACQLFDIPDTRLFAVDDTGISELNPANGEVINSFAAPFPLSASEHYALAYDQATDQLFLHDAANQGVDPNPPGSPALEHRKLADFVEVTIETAFSGSNGR